MDWELTANRNGHIACTQGGESLAGLVRAMKQGIIQKNEIAVINSTAHVIKFSGFQQMYFEDSFPDQYGIKPDPEKKNSSIRLDPGGEIIETSQMNYRNSKNVEINIDQTILKIAECLSIKK